VRGQKDIRSTFAFWTPTDRKDQERVIPIFDYLLGVIEEHCKTRNVEYGCRKTYIQ
jgi:hypothetical protein